MKKKHLIKKMPSRKILEAFLEGFMSDTTVIFNSDKGEFEWIVPPTKHEIRS